jgi:YihY family inner membrane protein
VVTPVVRSLDAFQQRHRPTAVAVAVVRKLGDDDGGTLINSIAFAGFVSVFPLLLILFTVLDLVLSGDPHARATIAHSALAQFPLVGEELGSNIHGLRRTSVIGLVVGIVVLLWGSMALARAGQVAMSRVWAVHHDVRPRFGARLVRSLGFLGVLGLGVAATSALAGFGTVGGRQPFLGAVGEVLALVLNVVVYLLVFRILTPPGVRLRQLVPGSVVGGIGWTVLQALGGYVVGRYLRHAGQVYGTFGAVLGLTAWIYLGARLSIVAAELNPVLSLGLWPRGLAPPPSTPADRRALALAARGPTREVDGDGDAVTAGPD